MTFTEAAEAVLRKWGKALHFKKITQLAIEQNLLSHIGKTPETTMSTRLATLTKKDRGEQKIVRVGAGLFGLREWGAAAAPEAPDAPAEAPAEAAAGEPEHTREAGEELVPGEVTPEAAAAPEPPAPRRVPPPEPVAPRSAEELERDTRLAAAAEMFPEEDDDEEPLLGGDKPETEGGRRRRRRRRGRGRGPEGAVGTETRAEGASAAPEAPAEATAPGAAPAEGASVEPSTGVDAPVVSASPSEEGAPEAQEAPGASGGDAPEGAREPREGREGAREARDGGREPRSDDRRRDDRRRDERRDDRRGPREGREGRDAPREEARSDERRDEDTGRDAADLVVSMLTRREDRQPVALRALVDEALRTGRLSGDVGLHVSALSAAVRMDSAKREARGERPRLRAVGGRVGLVDWTLPVDVVRAEADALAALERLRDSSRRYVVRRLNELPQAGFTEVVVALLERLGISSLKGTRRPGLPQGEAHLAGVSRRGPEELRVGVVLKRGGEVGRERVIELRGSAYQYGPAAAFWIITTGNVLSGAREEASQPGTLPVTLVDAGGLGRLLDENAVGVRHTTVSLPYLDVDLYDALRTV
ncbi:MAG: restriction endonuclease [Deltaproteobacteria bacterium]|nr:restriction endonuclease [Deltaproteobacteria bacterium]